MTNDLLDNIQKVSSISVGYILTQCEGEGEISKAALYVSGGNTTRFRVSSQEASLSPEVVPKELARTFTAGKRVWPHTSPSVDQMVRAKLRFIGKVL